MKTHIFKKHIHKKQKTNWLEESPEKKRTKITKNLDVHQFFCLFFVFPFCLFSVFWFVFLFALVLFFLCFVFCVKPLLSLCCLLVRQITDWKVPYYQHEVGMAGYPDIFFHKSEIDGQHNPTTSQVAWNLVRALRMQTRLTRRHGSAPKHDPLCFCLWG